MAQLTISVKVNQGSLKTLQKNIDETISKVGNLNNVLSNIGAKVNTNGFKSTESAMANLMKNAQQSKNGIEKIAENVNTNGLTGIDAILAHINANAVNTKAQITGMGQNVSTTGLQNIEAKLSELVKISQATQSSIAKMGTHVDSSGIDSLSAKIDGLSNQIGSQLGGAINTAVSFLGGKSISDLTIFNALDKEVNKVLITGLADSSKQAVSYWNTIDQATNNALVSMRQAVPAINAIQSATGASGAEMEKASPNVIAFGSYVQALTGSSALAETAMFSLSKGINGAYAALDQYGVTEESLMRTGLWDGSKEDVEGFTAAVVQATGAVEKQDALMNTTRGKLTTMYKQLSVEGAKAGADILNALTPLINGFISLNKSMDGLPAKLVLIGGMGAIALTGLAPLLSSLKSIFGVFGKVGGMAGGMGKNIPKLNLMSKFLNLGSMSLTTMVMPLLKISAVIAIMIPVVTGLAIEAALFIRLLAEAIKFMQFDKINLKSSITGIKQIGSAMFELAKALGAVTLVNVVGILHTLTGGVMTFTASLLQFYAELQIAIPILNQIANMPNIDSNVGTKITQFNTAMTQIVSATKSMDTLSSTQFNWNPATNYIKAIKQAKTDIMGSINTVNSMASMANVNPMAVNKIKQISTALGSVAEAVKSMDSVSSAQFNWNPWTDFNKAINQAKSDIKEASESLRGMELATIPKGVVDKMKATSNVLTDVKTALVNMNNISSTQFNWNPWTDFNKAINQAKSDITEASRSLADMELATIPEGVGNKLQRVSWTLNNVKTALIGLSDINNVTVDINLSSFISSLHSVRTQLGNASILLAGFTTLANIPEGVGAKIQRVTWSLNTVKTAITSLSTINTSVVEVDLSSFIAKLHSVRTQIGQASIILAGFNTIAVIDSSVGAKINSVKNASNSLKGAVTSLNGIPAPNGNNLSLAVRSIKSAITELNKLGGAKVNGNLAGLANGIRSAINNVRNALNSGSGVQSAARGLGTKIVIGLKSGMVNIKSVASSSVQNGVSAIASKASAAWTAGSQVGSAAVRGFKDGLNSGSPGDIARIMEKEIGTYVPQLVWRQSGAVVAMMIRVAKEATEATGKGIHRGSPGDIAKIYGKEIGEYAPLLIEKGATNVYRALSILADKSVAIIDSAFIKMYSTISGYNDLTKNFIEGVTPENTRYSFEATTKLAESYKTMNEKIKAVTTSTAKYSKTLRKTINAIKSSKLEQNFENIFGKVSKNQARKEMIASIKQQQKQGKISAKTAKKRINDIKKHDKGVNAYRIKAQQNDANKYNNLLKTASKYAEQQNLKGMQISTKKITNIYNTRQKKIAEAMKKQNAIINNPKSSKSAIKTAKKEKATLQKIDKQEDERYKKQKEAMQSISDSYAQNKKVIESINYEHLLDTLTGTSAELDKYEQAFNKINEQRSKYKQAGADLNKDVRVTLSEQKKYISTMNVLTDKWNYYNGLLETSKDKYKALQDEAEASASSMQNLAKAFNNLNKNTVDINLNMAGAVELLSKDPKFSNIDTSKLQDLFFKFLKEQLA